MTDKIEKVKKILEYHSFDEDGFNVIPTREHEEIAKQICQLFEPEEAPAIDLNSLFKYAMSELFRRGLDLHVFSDDRYWFAYCITNDLEHKRCFDSVVGTEKVEDAIYETIYKAFGGKE